MKHIHLKKKYHNFIKEQQIYLFDKFYENNGKENIKSILYDVKANPQKYFYIHFIKYCKNMNH